MIKKKQRVFDDDENVIVNKFELSGFDLMSYIRETTWVTV